MAGPDDRVGVALIVWRNDAGGFGAVQRIAGGQPEPTVGPVPVTVDPRTLFA